MFPLREVNSKHHNYHISEAIVTLQLNNINHRLHSKPQHRRETGQGIANRRTGLARSCRHCYLLRSASSQSMAPRGSPLYFHSACTQRATFSLPIMDWTWATALRSSTVGRSSRVVQVAKLVGRTRSSRSTLSVSLSVGVGGWGWWLRCWLQGTGAEGVAVFGGPGLADLLELR